MQDRFHNTRSGAASANGMAIRWRFLLLAIAVMLALPGRTVLAQSIWTSLSKDGADGATPGLPDAKEIWYRFDPVGDTLWFRIDLQGTLNTTAFGINIVFKTPEDGPAILWWGSNKFAFNKLATVWVMGPPYTGFDGIADVNGILAQNYTNLGQDNVAVKLDNVGNSYIVGMKRTDVYGGDLSKVEFVIAVGSNQLWNDDVPDTGSVKLAGLAQSAVATPAGAPEGLSVAAYPNPFGEHGAIEYLVDGSSRKQVRLSVVDLAGREIAVLRDELLDPGHYSAAFDDTGIPAGTYFARLTADGEVRVVPIVVVR